MLQAPHSEAAKNVMLRKKDKKKNCTLQLSKKKNTEKIYIFLAPVEFSL